MGNKISIDKYVSNLDDILKLNTKYFSTIKFENENIPETVAQHLKKIWRFYLEGSILKTEPVALQTIKNTKFELTETESYLVLLVFKDSPPNPKPIVFPHSLWGIVESYKNLAPSGLSNPISASVDVSAVKAKFTNTFGFNKHPRIQSKESQSHPSPKPFQDNENRQFPEQEQPRKKKIEKGNELKEFNYMLFVWNGKSSREDLKSFCLTKGFELESFIKRSGSPFLHVLFSGGVFKNSKLSSGTILQLISSSSKKYTKEHEKAFQIMKKSVFLFAFLFQSENETEESRQELKKERGAIGDIFKRISTKKSSLLEELFVNAREDQMEIPEKMLVRSDLHRDHGVALRGGNGQKDSEQKKRRSEEAKAPDTEAFEAETQPNKKEKEELPPVLKKNQNEMAHEHGKVSLDQKKHQVFPVPRLPLMSIGTMSNKVPNPPGSDQMPSSASNKSDPKPSPRKSLVSSNSSRVSKGCEESKSASAVSSRVESDVSSPIVSSRSNNENFGAPSSVSKKLDIKGLALPGIKGIQGEKPEAKGPVIKMQINLGQISLKPRTEFKYEDIEKELQEGDFDFDVRDTDRKILKMEHFSDKCSEILKSFLYVSGESIAKDKEELKKNGITHVINCAGDACENSFKGDFKYLTYYLKDSKSDVNHFSLRNSLSTSYGMRMDSHETRIG